MLYGFWGVAWLLPEINEYWVPVVGIISGCLMVIVIVALVTMTRQRQTEMEHTLQLRRMEHERRMKELEVELARLQGGAAAQRK